MSNFVAASNNGAFGTLAFSVQFGKSEILRGARTFALTIAVLAVIFFLVLGVVMARAKLSDKIFGLVERLFIGFVLFWMFAMSFYLGRLASNPLVKTS